MPQAGVPWEENVRHLLWAERSGYHDADPLAGRGWLLTYHIVASGAISLPSRGRVKMGEIKKLSRSHRSSLNLRVLRTSLGRGMTGTFRGNRCALTTDGPWAGNAYGPGVLFAPVSRDVGLCERGATAC